MNKENKLVPELRFPEFVNGGEWSIKNGDKVFDQISNKKHNSDLPILAITQEYGAIPREQIDYTVIVTDKSVESYKVVEVGDFIISLRSFQGGIEYSNYKGLCSPAYIILRKKNQETVDSFYKQYFKYDSYIIDLNRDLEGIRDGKMVSYKQFSKILLPNPNPAEQQKIASCLSSLDELINAHSQKLDALKEHKKGLMQQLFPAEGETVPKLRFKEFEKAGEWVEVTLGKTFSILQGFAFSSNDTSSEGTRWLKIADVSIQQMNYNSPSYLPFDFKERFQKFLVRKGDYVIALTRPILGKELKLAPVDEIYHESLLNQRVGKLKSENNLTFIYYLLQTTYIMSQIEKNIAGSEPPNLSTQHIENIVTYLPPKPNEQQKIANSLSSIDDEIAAQTQKIEGLKEHKKGLMQGLFPVINE